MHPDLQEAIAFHESILGEADKALVGYKTPKILANLVLLSEIPTTYDKKEQRQVNSGNLLLRGVPGVGKTFFGVILAAISGARFARIQGRADLQPTEVVGFQMINPATGELTTEMGPLAAAEVILLDEINRIPLKSQSAFLEALQDRTVTVGKTTYELPAFSFAIATMNPVELGQGTFPLSEAATDRFAIMVNIGYLPPEEERKLVNFDFKQIRLNSLMDKARIIQLRSAISAHVFLHERLGDYIQRLVASTRPYNQDIDWLVHSPSELVEDRRRSRRLTSRDHRLGPPGQGVGAARPPPRRGLPRRHSTARAVRAGPPHLARATRGQPRADHRSRRPGHRGAHADTMTARSLRSLVGSPLRGSWARGLRPLEGAALTRRVGLAASLRRRLGSFAAPWARGLDPSRRPCRRAHEAAKPPSPRAAKRRAHEAGSRASGRPELVEGRPASAKATAVRRSASREGGRAEPTERRKARRL